MDFLPSVDVDGVGWGCSQVPVDLFKDVGMGTHGLGGESFHVLREVVDSEGPSKGNT